MTDAALQLAVRSLSYDFLGQAGSSGGGSMPAADESEARISSSLRPYTRSFRAYTRSLRPYTRSSMPAADKSEARTSSSLRPYARILVA